MQETQNKFFHLSYVGAPSISSFVSTVCVINLVIIVGVTAGEGDGVVSESLMELMMEAFEMQCHANLQQAIRTVDGLGIEYDENVVCDICRSVC